MANICLIDVDGHNGFPNYAKIAAWHKKQGDNVSWFSPLFSKPDICYASKIFTFTKDSTGEQNMKLWVSEWFYLNDGKRRKNE